MTGMTKKEFRAMVAEKVMPGLDFMTCSLLSIFLNRLDDATFALVQEMFTRMDQVFQERGPAGVRELLPDELVDRVGSWPAIPRRWLCGNGGRRFFRLFGPPLGCPLAGDLGQASGPVQQREQQGRRVGHGADGFEDLRLEPFHHAGQRTFDGPSFVRLHSRFRSQEIGGNRRPTHDQQLGRFSGALLFFLFCQPRHFRRLGKRTW